MEKEIDKFSPLHPYILHKCSVFMVVFGCFFIIGSSGTLIRAWITFCNMVQMVGIEPPISKNQDKWQVFRERCLWLIAFFRKLHLRIALLPGIAYTDKVRNPNEFFGKLTNGYSCHQTDYLSTHPSRWVFTSLIFLSCQIFLLQETRISNRHFS